MVESTLGLLIMLGVLSILGAVIALKKEWYHLAECLSLFGFVAGIALIGLGLAVALGGE